MYAVYVLYSIEWEKIYVGYTSNLIARFHSHNHLGSGWTKRYRPWMVVHLEFFKTKTDARKREKELKSHQGREFIRRKIIQEWGTSRAHIRRWPDINSPVRFCQKSGPRYIRESCIAGFFFILYISFGVRKWNKQEYPGKVNQRPCNSSCTAFGNWSFILKAYSLSHPQSFTRRTW